MKQSVEPAAATPSRLPVRSRWKRSFCFCIGIALFVAALEWAGFRQQDVPVQIVFLGGATLLGGLALAWAAAILRKVLLLYATCLLTLIAAEGALRLNPEFDPPMSGEHDLLFRFDRKLGWRFIPNSQEEVEFRGQYKTTVNINSEGFRDSEPDPSDHRPQVAVLGDSFVTNFGVEAPEVFTELMRNHLGARAAVRNYGVNGYGQVQELLLLDELLASHKIAMTLVVVYLRNDFDDNLGLFDWTRGYHRPYGRLKPDGQIEILSQLRDPDAAPTPRPENFLLTVNRTIEETRIYRLLAQAHARLFPGQQPASMRPPELRYGKRSLDAEEQNAVAITQALLRDMKQKCDQHHSRFGVILAPSLWQVEQARWDRLLRDNRLDPQDYERTLPNRLLAEYCAAHGYPCLDLLPALEECAASGESLYYPREQHWNSLGQQRVAEAIVAWMQQLGFPGQAAP
jgi:hypothetical protein